MRLLLFAVAMVAAATAHAGTNTAIEIHDTLHGHFVYMKNCVFCHGRRGDGRGDMGLTVKPAPRDFTTGIFKYRSTPSGSLPTDEDLMRVVREGIGDTAMPSFSAIPARDVRAVVQYVKTFSAKWRHSENYAEPIALPPKPEWFNDAQAVVTKASAGKKVFAVSCSPCHGASGDGRGTAANLNDSWGNPIVPRDLARAYIRSGRRLEDIYRVLVTGIDGTPMPSFADSTTPEQRWELVAFIAELRRSSGDGATPLR